jgi:hypothetical protein
MHQATRLAGVAAGPGTGSTLVKVDFERLDRGGSAA